MTKIKGVMMSSEALEPAGFISEYKVDGMTGSSTLSNNVKVDQSNDDIYMYSSGTATISGTSESGQAFAKIEPDPTDANFGLITNLKMIKMSSGQNSSIQSFAISSNYVHGAQLNYVNTAASTRNYATHFRTDKNFNSPTALNSYNSTQLSTWGAANGSIPSMHHDTSDGAYLAQSVNQGTTSDLRGSGIVKVNSSSSQQWKQFIVGTSDNTYRIGQFQDIHANANGYSALSVQGDGSATGANNVGVVGFFNSSGTQQWIKWFKNNYYWQVRGIHVDSSNNVYICGDNGPNSGYGYNYPVVLKLNSSGTLQWVRKLNLTLPSSTTSAGWVAHVYSKNIVVHGSDVYVAIRFVEADPRNNIFSLDNRCGIMKLDTSGNFGYYREITDASTDTGMVVSSYTWHKQLDIDSQGNLIFTFKNSSAGTDILMKIPQSRAQSGNFTGTYLGAVKINALSASFFTPPLTVSNWPVSATTSPYVLTGSNASLTALSPSTTTNTTSYLY